MTKPDPVAIVKRFVYEVQQNGKIDLIKDLVAEDFVDHTGPQGGDSGTVYATKLISGLHLAVTDVKVEILHCISEGRMVATNKIIRGVQKGEFFGKPATGGPIEMKVMDFIIVVDGKLKEHWATTGQIVDL